MVNRPGGKGSHRRPSQVSTKDIDANFDAIFGKKKVPVALEECKNDCPGCTCKQADVLPELVGGFSAD